MAVSDAVDLAVFEGDSNANEDAADITGLDTAADVAEQTLTQALKLKGTNVLSAFAAMIDGKHATSGSDLRVVLSVGAQRLWMSTLANSGNAADTTISEFLTLASGFQRVAASIRQPRRAPSALSSGALVGSRGRESRPIGRMECSWWIRIHRLAHRKYAFRSILFGLSVCRGRATSAA